jgi:protein subunit release factor A
MTNKIIVEIRAAEGGQDSKLLVEDMFAIYGKLCTRERL